MIAPLKTFFVLGCFCLLLMPGTGFGAQNWLDQGKKALQTLTSQDSGQALSSETINDGLKEALRVGTARVVDQLGQAGGFFNNPDIHIPLPDSMNTVQSALAKVGASGMLDDLELKLNQAAERATPKAKDMFWQAISEMTLDDVQAIYNGPDDAATRYFQEKMSAPLALEMQPVIENTLSEVGAVRTYDHIMDRYTAIPFVPDVKADLVSYTVDNSLGGLFSVLAQEETAIRTNPGKRTSDLLKKVFGQN